MTVFPFSHFNFYTGSYGIHQIFFQRAEIRIRFIRRLPLLSVFFTAEDFLDTPCGKIFLHNSARKRDLPGRCFQS